MARLGSKSMPTMDPPGFMIGSSALASEAYEYAEMWMPLATSSYGASKNGLMPIPVCGMKPIECTTPSSLLPSPISAVTRSPRVSRCFSFCTSSSISGAFSGSRSAMRWISRNRSNPVSTNCAPASWATLAM